MCELGGAKEHGDFRATSLATLLQMVVGGLGVTLVPEMVAEQLPAGLVTLSFQSPAPTRAIGVAWRQSSPHSEAYRLLAKSLIPKR